MAKNTFLDWSETASNNTDIGGIGVQGTNAVSNFDDAFRTLMAQLRAGVDGEVVYLTKSANYTALANDNNAFVRFSAAATLSLTAAATLGVNWHIRVVADGGDVIIDPNSAELIDGAATLTVKNGYTAYIVCTGTAFVTDKVATSLSVFTSAGYLYRLTLSNNSGDPTNDIDIAAGAAASDGATPVLMTLASGITKRLDAAWAVGTGNGGRMSAAAIADTTYHVWLIQRSDTGVVDVGFDVSATAPTMPANYDRKRRIGSIVREVGSMIGFIQYGTQFIRNTPVSVGSFNNPGTAAVTRTLSVPTGIVTDAISTVLIDAAASGSTALLLTALSQADTTPSVSAFTFFAATSGRVSGQVKTRTNTSAQIRSRFNVSDASTQLTIITHGWEDVGLLSGL